ncbi:uncharacterized protein LOC108103467 [Drosophila eugracilis]|uniref:uncharacterized protein LOC108103467 n=1 Tax=Drosophila eugracilis TaxID=29029 RepID=UPI0007E76FD3|nr:uncharacterized protein LOC108103467 [Drosophila eugracilis]XP_017064452.1 uncharacterized protein LOC108103467 [Drosophila eugracilis]XP_017064453.1 uncharacterized protein LOC108103467 [Drosophila eugracilis]XP_017064454.1 uncharacterized protein LOC108103467 [Drosophila eugracilis]
MHKNHSVISQDPKMASLTLHLIVIALLASTAASQTTPTATTTTAATRQRGRGFAAQGVEGLGLGGRVTGGVPVSTTSTEAPTLRAPRQRRPPTTQSIDLTVTVTPIRSRSRSSGSLATPTTTTAATTNGRVLQRRRSSTSSTTTTTTEATAKAGRSSRDRGSVRGPRQPRDTPELGGDTSIRRSWQSASPTASPYQAHAPTSSYSFSSTPSTTSSRGALKTPRMIQRLVAGHIQNAQGHSTYEVSAVSANSSSSTYIPSTTARSTSTSTTTTTPSTTTSTTTKKPPSRSKASSSYRLAKPSSRPRLTSTVANTRFSNPPSTSRSTTPLPPPRSNTPNSYRQVESDDDEALLNEPDDFDNWDNGILRLSAGSGKEAEAPAKKQPKEDQKKTLADQVRDGKYGLIEKELFRRVPKRPGVLSYARNSEVPLDNERNYGGLNEEDIWLAEDHLLVIKGGALNEESEDNQHGPWPAIDDYDAPGRQIKLPANPAVPPPFPVQLEPHGPLQLIRDNQLEILRPASGNATISSKTANYQSHQSAAGENSASHPVARTGATAASPAAKSTDARDSPDAPAYVYPAPYAPWLLYPNDTVASKGLLRTPPLLGPWLINGLNGNGSLVGDSQLPGNVSDFDEDDPSLYYPPAYTFVYKSNYSNPVPPGPLVPGIVLPPPPDHFSRLEGSVSTRRPQSSSSTTTSTTSTTTTSTTTTTSRPPAQLPPVRTSYKPKYNGITYLPPPPRQSSPKYVERVPVPVAVPIPIYPVNYTPRPQLVFVSSSTEGSRQDQSLDPPLSKSNPIYYEYFEAKRQPGSIKSNVIDDFLATKPPKRHHHNNNHHQREHLQHYKASPSPANDVAPEVVNITPKPRTAQLQLHAEYEASLGQLLRSNLISPPGGSNSGRFQAPDFDKQPFLPMVNYSADEHDQNAFKAIVYQPPGQRQRHLRVGKQQLQLDPNLEAAPPDSYLPGRHYRVGKQQQQIYEPQIYSTPVPQFLEDPQQLRPPSPVQSSPLQFWQRPPPQFKRVRPSSKQGHPHSHPHYPPYYVPGYPSAPSAEPLYRLVPVAQHKHWRNKQQQPQQVQSQPIQVQAQNQGYPDRSVNIGHSLAGDILVNYNTNNQFNPQAELVPQAQLAAPPPPPPLSYQAQSGQPLWSERERDRDRERSVRQSREQQK